MNVLVSIITIVTVFIAVFLLQGKISARNYSRLLRDLKKLPITRIHYPYAIIDDFRVWAFWVGDTKVSVNKFDIIYSYGSSQDYKNIEIRLLPIMFFLILKNRGISRALCDPYDGSTVHSRLEYNNRYR